MKYKKSIYENILEPILVFSAILGIYFGFKYDYIYFLIPFFAIIILILLNRMSIRKVEKMYIERVNNMWGKERSKAKNSLGFLEKMYSIINKSDKKSFTIDNITWEDLNMDQVFLKIDFTMSLPGMYYLYSILRKPLFYKKDLLKRDKIIEDFQDNKEISKEIQIPLFKLGKEKGEEILSYFEEGINVNTRKLYIYRILSVLPLLSPFLIIVDSSLGFSIFVVSIIINSGIYQSEKNKIANEVGIFQYIGELIRCGNGIVKINKKNINYDLQELEESLLNTKKILKSISKISTGSNFRTELEILIDYFNMITLRETIDFYKSVNLLNQKKEEVEKVYLNIGKIDAYIGMASLRDSNIKYCKPNLLDGDYRFSLSCEDLYHPLLDKPVPYIFDLDNQGALITGSNASGKSTFLRAIGINAIFSQTIYIVMAEKYRANYFKVITSIGTTDSIEKGESYFMAEAKSLKRILDEVGDKDTVLCILDEIFRGTNTAERISAASEVLDYLIGRNCCVVAATHDLELTTIVDDDSYINFHFREEIKEKDIKFDYILRHGPCSTRNAIEILKYLGYPEDLCEKANKRAIEYLAI